MSNQPKQAVIYCRSAVKPKRYDFSLNRQEDTCRKYAEKYGIEVLEAFTDSGTNEPPQVRIGFMAMQEFLRNAEEPLMVLVQDL